MPPFVRPLAYNSLKHFAYFITILIILLNVISVSLPIFFPWPGLGLGLEGIKEINNLISLRNLMEQLGGKQQQRREVPAVVTETVQQEPITNTVTKTQVVRVIPQGEWWKQSSKNPSPTLSLRHMLYALFHKVSDPSPTLSPRHKLYAFFHKVSDGNSSTGTHHQHYHQGAIHVNFWWCNHITNITAPPTWLPQPICNTAPAHPEANAYWSGIWPWCREIGSAAMNKLVHHNL